MTPYGSRNVSISARHFMIYRTHSTRAQVAVRNQREYGKTLEFIGRDEEIFAIAEATVEHVESHCGYERCWRDRLALGHASIDVYMPRRTCQRANVANTAFLRLISLAGATRPCGSNAAPQTRPSTFSAADRSPRLARSSRHRRRWPRGSDRCSKRPNLRPAGR